MTQTATGTLTRADCASIRSAMFFAKTSRSMAGSFSDKFCAEEKIFGSRFLVSSACLRLVAVISSGSRASNHLREFGREACVTCLDMTGQSRGDLLKHPAIAVGI